MTEMTPRVGDVFLIASPGFVGAAIRLLTRSRWNHAGLIVATPMVSRGPASAAGPARLMVVTVEALQHGTRRGELRTGPVLLLRPPYGYRDNGVLQRAIHEANANADRGTPYAFTDLGYLALAQLGIRTRWLKRNLGRPDRMFCSQEVDDELTLAGVPMFDDGRMPQDVTPGDLEELAISRGWQLGRFDYVNTADRH